MILADQVHDAFSGWSLVGFFIFLILWQVVHVLVEMAWERRKARSTNNDSYTDSGMPS